MKPIQKPQRSSRTFLVGLLVSGTFGAAAMAPVFWWQGAKFPAINSILGGALMIGLLSALFTSVCSQSGRNAPGKTARRATLFCSVWFAVLVLTWTLTGQSPGGDVAALMLALGATLIACSALGAWLSRRRGNSTPV